MNPFENAFHRAAERHERVWVFVVMVMLALLTLVTLATTMLDYGLVTRAAGTVADPATLARNPAGFVPGVVRTGPASFTVRVVGRAWSWTPGLIHVPEGATVTFLVTSADVLHGFEVQGTPINLTVVPGIIGSISFTFRHAGRFHIICNEYCGMMHQAMLGLIVVDPAPAR